MAIERMPGLDYFDICGLTYNGNLIGTVTYALNDALGKNLIFNLDWSQVDKFPDCDVPGLDMDLRLTEYVREFPCVFIDEYLPPDGRPDVRDILRSVKLDPDGYDMWDLAKASYRMCGDYFNIYHIRTIDRGNVIEESERPIFLYPDAYTYCVDNGIPLTSYKE
ncbi:MAG: hypothetical protein NC548_10625 [Lachnospiraceae bacterium]|nr:hypothetical protein [Lachnospiraceae bacterium]